MAGTGKTIAGAVHNPGLVFIKAELTVSSDGLRAVCPEMLRGGRNINSWEQLKRVFHIHPGIQFLREVERQGVCPSVSFQRAPAGDRVGVSTSQGFGLSSTLQSPLRQSFGDFFPRRKQLQLILGDAICS